MLIIPNVGSPFTFHKFCIYLLIIFFVCFHIQAEKTALMKAEMKERTMKIFLLSQKNIVYTDPLDVQAGGVVSVFYNPTNTVLNGKPEVWFRCSFNRWTHRLGPLPPQKMLPADNGTHVKASGKLIIYFSMATALVIASLYPSLCLCMYFW